MSEQEDLSENERLKSTVRTSTNPAGVSNGDQRASSSAPCIDNNNAQRDAGFGAKDSVKMIIEETKIDGKSTKRSKTFKVANSRLSSGQWEYQLTDPITDALWKEGKWFEETEIEMA